VTEPRSRIALQLDIFIEILPRTPVNKAKAATPWPSGFRIQAPQAGLVVGTAVVAHPGAVAHHPIAIALRTNFLERRQREVRRITLLRGSVNKAGESGKDQEDVKRGCFTLLTKLLGAVEAA